MQDLFDPTQLPLLADAEGGIRYWPGFLAPAESDQWFAVLLAKAEWSSQRRKMYDRIVNVPRLMAAYCVKDLPDELPLTEILARVQALVPAPYNAIGLNLYRNGQDSVAMHNDKLHSIVAGQPIALLSLGEPRRMLIRAKAGKRERIGLDLEHGSLLTMSHASQLTHEHGIPKTKRMLGPRISAVFRVRPHGWTAE